MRSFVARVFSVDNLTGDVRAAVIGSVTGAIVGLLAAAFFGGAALEFTVGVNSDGYGQPKALFDTAEKEDSKLKLQFVPPDLRNAYVCEFKHITGDDWKKMVLNYFDTYRECFDVSAQGENSFTVFPNNRSTRLVKKGSTFLCKCNGVSTNQ